MNMNKLQEIFNNNSQANYNEFKIIENEIRDILSTFKNEEKRFARGGKEPRKSDEKNGKNNKIQDKPQDKLLNDIKEIGDMLLDEMKNLNQLSGVDSNLVNIIMKIIKSKNINITISDFDNLINYIKKKHYLTQNDFKNHSLNSLLETGEIKNLLHEISDSNNIFYHKELDDFSKHISEKWKDISSLDLVPIQFGPKMIPSALFTLCMLKTAIEKLYLYNVYEKVIFNFSHQQINKNDTVLLNLRLSDPHPLFTTNKIYNGSNNELLRIKGSHIIRNLYINARNGVFTLPDKTYNEVLDFFNITRNTKMNNVSSMCKTSMDIVSYKPLIMLDNLYQNGNGPTLYSTTHIELKVNPNKTSQSIKLNSDILNEICYDQIENKLYVTFDNSIRKIAIPSSGLPINYMMNSPGINMCDTQKSLVLAHQRIIFSIERGTPSLKLSDLFVPIYDDNLYIEYPDNLVFDNVNYKLRAVDAYEVSNTNCLTACKNAKPIGTVSLIKDQTNQWYEYRPLEGFLIELRKERYNTYIDYLFKTSNTNNEEMDTWKQLPEIKEKINKAENDILKALYKSEYMKVTPEYVYNKASKNAILLHYIKEDEHFASFLDTKDC